ncbi:hypothetical protein ZIOFF_019610 [Zingiber officinale]|uniref:Gnk2-homologous domain-containing protein n=1 Tax=Zingiber officinale TaxID=94328 RepID=A0A8J5H795_ZINOF|nr:hypothetical protein ZIOFF_019610 [Zingiber officinale]
MAQCQGDRSVSDCGECVAQAVQKSEVECGGAASGQIYLDKCYVSYSYYTNGIPHGTGSVGGEETVGVSNEKTKKLSSFGVPNLCLLASSIVFANSLLITEG